MPHYNSTCKNGCADWATAGGSNTTLQQVINAMFANGTVPAGAGSQCAMPAAHAGDHECDCGQKDGDEYIYDSYNGPWCFCKDPDPGVPNSTALYCTPPRHIPEQINLQVHIIMCHI